MKKIKVGVVGVGHLGKFHVEKYSRMPEVDLVGIADIVPERRKALSEQYEVPGYDDYRQLIPQVDAVSIVVPTRQHASVARDFLDQKIDVLIEKPICSSMAEARELIAMAGDRDCLLQVGHLERFNPVFLKVQPLIKTPLFFESHRLSPFKARAMDVDVVLDLMIHDLDIIIHLVQSPAEQIQAVGVPVVSSKVDIANVRIQFQSGCVANITASRISLQEMRKMRIFQPAGYVALDFGKKSYSVVRLKTEKIGAALEPEFDSENGTIDSGDALEMELRAFVEAVKTRSAPVVCGEDGEKALDMALWINREIKKNLKSAAQFPGASEFLKEVSGITTSGKPQ